MMLSPAVIANCPSPCPSPGPYPLADMARERVAAKRPGEGRATFRDRAEAR
jgi:hypothetical protein